MIVCSNSLEEKEYSVLTSLPYFPSIAASNPLEHAETNILLEDNYNNIIDTFTGKGMQPSEPTQPVCIIRYIAQFIF